MLRGNKFNHRAKGTAKSVMLSGSFNTIGEMFNNSIKVLQYPEFNNVFSLFYELPSHIKNDLNIDVSNKVHSESLIDNLGLKAIENSNIMIKSHDEIFEYFHSKGLNKVCLILGRKGVVLSEKGKETVCLTPENVKKSMMLQGADKLAWSGFLFSYVYNKYTQSSEVNLKFENVMNTLKNLNVLRYI